MEYWSNSLCALLLLRFTHPVNRTDQVSKVLEGKLSLLSHCCFSEKLWYKEMSFVPIVVVIWHMKLWKWSKPFRAGGEKRSPSGNKRWLSVMVACWGVVKALVKISLSTICKELKWRFWHLAAVLQSDMILLSPSGSSVKHFEFLCQRRVTLN